MTPEERLARRIIEFHDSMAAQGIGPRLVFGAYVAIIVLSLRSVSERLGRELLGDMADALEEAVPYLHQPKKN